MTDRRRRSSSGLQIRPVSDEVKYRKAVQAVRSGDNSAKTTIAFNLLSGRGNVEVDQDRAVALLEERVKDRDAEAMWMLGVCCEYGIGTEQDLKRAELLFSKSRRASNRTGRFLWDYLKDDRGNGTMVVRGLLFAVYYPKFCSAIVLFLESN